LRGWDCHTVAAAFGLKRATEVGDWTRYLQGTPSDDRIFSEDPWTHKALVDDQGDRYIYLVQYLQQIPLV
jgi:hypothetical protein